VDWSRCCSRKQSRVNQANGLQPTLTGPACSATLIIIILSSTTLRIDSYVLSTTARHSPHRRNPHRRPTTSHSQPPPQPLDVHTSPKTDNGKMNGNNNLGTLPRITRKRRTTYTHKIPHRRVLDPPWSHRELLHGAISSKTMDCCKLALSVLDLVGIHSLHASYITLCRP
jgi:hypothetical protein